MYIFYSSNKHLNSNYGGALYVFTAVERLEILLSGGNSETLWFVKTSPNPTGYAEKFKVIDLAQFLES